jgi:hypothetical protein
MHIENELVEFVTTGEQEYDEVIEEYEEEVLVLFSLPVSIEDRPLHWTLVKSQTYYLEHILSYGSRKACYSLVMGFGSFRTD